MEIACIRGAVTVGQNDKDEMLLKTRELLTEIFQRNGLSSDMVLSILFTVTKDLDVVYPAVAARELGVNQGALMCMQEMFVVGSLAKCIRVMVVAPLSGGQKEAQHVFLGEAGKLRPDLKQ